MVYKPLDTERGTEIFSVEGYLGAISALNKRKEMSDAQLFFRGQEVDYWKVEPSIFRDNMLSVEHILMTEPLRQIPSEFREMRSDFEIIEKYQHYGMCTRLLDITTNPLVALYFACKEHGVEEYQNDNGIYQQKPCGIILYKEERNPVVAESQSIQIILALSKYNLGEGTTIADVLKKLLKEHVISDEQSRRWLTKEGIVEFIRMVQNVYTVLHILSNKRLVRQSGAFLIPGKFNFTIVDGNVKDGIIDKCEGNLRDEFEESFFYIEGEIKKTILDELSNCNIHSASLFPELEYQLQHIKIVNESNARLVSYFEKFQGFSYGKQDTDTIDSGEFKQKEAMCELKDILQNDELINTVLKIFKDNQQIDWLKRDSILSKIKYEINRALLKDGMDRKSAQELAVLIVSRVKMIHLEKH